jgi:hypothetical protein
MQTPARMANKTAALMMMQVPAFMADNHLSHA